MEEQKMLYTIDEVCSTLGLSRSSVYRMMQKNEIPVLRIDRRPRVERSVLEKIIKKSK